MVYERAAPYWSDALQAFARGSYWFLLRLIGLIHHKNKRIFLKHTQSDQ